MATGTTTQYGSDVLLQTTYAPGVMNHVYYNNELFGLTHPTTGQRVFPVVQDLGDISSYRFKGISAGNSSTEIFSESAAQPTAVAQTGANLAIAFVYYRTMVRISGHVRDAVRNGASPLGINLLDKEFELSAQSLADLNTTTALSAANSGLQVAIDDTATYAGQARGSAGWFESTVTNENGALTIAEMRNTQEAAVNVEKAGNPSLILAPPNQITNYQALTGDIGASNGALRVILPDGAPGNKFDLSPNPAGAHFQGMPIVRMRDLTNTVMLGLDVTPGIWSFVVRREFDVRTTISGDDDLTQLSIANVLACEAPKKQWKLEGITA